MSGASTLSGSDQHHPDDIGVVDDFRERGAYDWHGEYGVEQWGWEFVYNNSVQRDIHPLALHQYRILSTGLQLAGSITNKVLNISNSPASATLIPAPHRHTHVSVCTVT